MAVKGTEEHGSLEDLQNLADDFDVEDDSKTLLDLGYITQDQYDKYQDYQAEWDSMAEMAGDPDDGIDKSLLEVRDKVVAAGETFKKDAAAGTILTSPGNPVFTPSTEMGQVLDADGKPISTSTELKDWDLVTGDGKTGTIVVNTESLKKMAGIITLYSEYLDDASKNLTEEISPGYFGAAQNLKSSIDGTTGIRQGTRNYLVSAADALAAVSKGLLSTVNTYSSQGELNELSTQKLAKAMSQAWAQTSELLEVATSVPGTDANPTTGTGAGNTSGTGNAAK